MVRVLTTFCIFIRRSRRRFFIVPNLNHETDFLWTFKISNPDDGFQKKMCYVDNEDILEFHNEHFKRDHPQLLNKIERRVRKNHQ